MKTANVEAEKVMLARGPLELGRYSDLEHILVDQLTVCRVEAVSEGDSHPADEQRECVDRGKTDEVVPWME